MDGWHDRTEGGGLTDESSGEERRHSRLRPGVLLWQWQDCERRPRPYPSPPLTKKGQMQVVPLGHVSQRTQRAPTPNSNSSTHCLLSVHPSHWIVEGTPHTGRPLSVIRQMPLWSFGHAVACDTLSSHEASSIVQPWALLGSRVHLLRRLLQLPEQHSDDWLQCSPGGRQAAATPGARPMSQNPEANAATAARIMPRRLSLVERDLVRVSKRTGSIARRPPQAI